jgi:hypothetical protein
VSASQKKQPALSQGAFQVLPKATVKFGEQLIRVYGDTAVDRGYYTVFIHEGR